MKFKNYLKSLCAVISIATPLSSSADVISVSPNVIESTLGSTLLVNQVVATDHAFLFTEQQNSVLSSDVLVNFAGPGDYDSFLSNEPAIIQIDAGTVFSSFLLHFDTPEATPSALSVSITFRDPILGIVTSTPDLLSTDSTLGLAAVQYEPIRHGRGLEGIDFLVPSDIDTVNISDDLRTITANLGVSGGLDNIRIVTAGIRAVPEPPVILLFLLPALLAFKQRVKSKNRR